MSLLPSKRSNFGEAARGEKRAKNDSPSYFELLDEAGCHLDTRDSGQHEFSVEDPRLLRRTLEQRLTLNQSLRAAFLDGVRDQLSPPDILRAALKPMTVSGPTALVTGDSFARALLNIIPLQKDLSEFLLQRIPEFSGDAAAPGNQPGSATLAQLILGQFRWLDCLADPHALVATLLEVLPAMPPEAQRDTIAFFPEVALEEDYPEVLDALEGLVAEGSEYLIPVLEATSNMALTDAMQTRVTQLVAARVQSCGVEDLPAVVRHLMQGIGSGKGSAAADALSTLRQALHFATPSDPRLAVPDRKQKQRVATCAAELPEARVLAAMRQAVQFGKGAADAVLKDVRGLTSPAQHRTFDFWLLLSTSALDADRRKGVLSVLRKKFGEGHAEPAWVERAVAGHSLALQEHFLELLVLAERLLADPGPAISAAGSVLCRGMFLEFKDPYRRQEVLLALHSHLGAAVPAEATTALGVLQSLARDATADLLEYAAFLTNILDYVTGYNDAQLAAAFDVFAELVTGTCTHGAATPDGMQLLSDPGEGRRTRMEDELFIFLRKQLSGALPAHRRVGAVGVVALVQRLARQMETDGEVETSESLLGQRYREARALLDVAFTNAFNCADTMTSLCDALATEAQRATLPRTLMKSLDETLSTSLEERYVADMSAWIGLGTLETGLPPAGAPAVQRAAWWNLTGTDDNLVVPLLPPAPTPGAAMLPGVSGGTAGSVAALFPMLRAVATFQMQLTGNLAAIDALIAAPFGLFPMEHAAPGVFASLDPGAQMTVLLGLFYALNWCRELASAFAPAFASTPSQESSQSLMKGMLLLRLRAACQLEAALAALLPMAPVAFHLPSLAKAAAGQGGVKANARSKKGPAKKKTAAVKVGYTEDGGDAVSEGTALQEDSGEHGGNADTRSNISNETRATAAAGGMARGEGSADGELPAAERLKLRSLQLSAVQALVIGKEMGTYLSLGPAAYLLADLAGKLRASLAAPKKATFLRPASQAAPTAVSAEAMLGMLRSIYPAMRHYLATGATVLEGGMADADMEAKDAPVLASWMSIAPSSNLPDLLQVLPDCESAAAAVAPSVAAGRVVTHALECFRLLFTFHAVAAPEHRTSLRAMLSALAPMPDGGSQPSSAAIDALPDPSQTWTPKQLLQGLVHAFSFFLQLAPVEEEVTVIFAEMERWPVILAILEALASVSRQLADEVAADDPKTAATWAKRMSTMHAKLAASAKHMLCHSWPAAAGSESASAGGWRGRAAALSAAVRIAVTYATDPIAQLSEFLHEVVSEVTTAPSGKSNAEPLADWPSMSGMTLITWYKALWDALLARWTEVVDSAAAIGKAPDAAPDAAAAIFAAVGACCEAFSDIVQVVRVQDRRPMLHIPAAKGAAVFLAGVKRVMPFWGAMFQENQEGIMVSIKAVQKGNRVLHSLCAEAKTRKDTALTTHVPKLKKGMEYFVLEAVAFFRELDPGIGVELGELKHRDLRGNVLVSSQMFPSQLPGDEEEEEDEEEEDEEEEEAEEAEGEGEEMDDGAED